MAIIDTNALAAALGKTTAPAAPAPSAPPAAAPQAAPVPAPEPSAAGGFDPTALRAALAPPPAPAAAPSAPAETTEQALAREAEDKRLRDAEANRAELEMYARTANHYLKGISPEVMSTVRRISREDGIPLPLAAQNYGLAIQKRSEEEFAAFSQAEPSFGKLASLVYQYPDLAGEGASLSTVLVAARNAFNRPEEEDLTTATQDLTAGVLGFSAGMTALGAALDEKSIQSLDQSAAYLQSITPEWEQLSGRYAEIDALLAQGDALSPEEQEALLTEQQDVAGRLALTNFGIGRGSPKDALARTIEDKQQAYRDVGTKLVQSLAASAAAADIPMNPAAARLGQSTTLEAALTEAFADPAGVIRSLGLRSLPSMAPPIIAGAAGALIAGPVGAAALAGLAGASVEMGATIQEGLQTELIAAGVDVTDPDAVTAWAQENTEAFAAIVQKATARAAVIGAFDAATGGLGGAIVRSTRGASTATRIATQVAVDTGLEGVGEAGGSAAAQLVTEGTLPTVGESLSELIAGTAMGAPSAALTLGADVLRETIQSEGGVKAVNNLVKEQLEQRQVAAEAVTTDLQIARAAVEEAKVFATDPETVRTLLETDDDGDVYIPASEVNRLYQEGALTDEDLQYLNVEQELIQQGELSGDVVIKRSALLTTKAEAFTALADHVRVTPDGTTAAEARANVANLEGEAARLESKMIQLINVEAEIDGLATQIYDSIPASPQVSRRQRQAVSRLMAQRYGTRAALFGPEVTAQSLYEADQLTFQQQGAGQASLEQAARRAGAFEFTRDNPEGEWLANKQARAAQYPDRKFMVGAITAVVGSRNGVFLPLSALQGIAGLNDEVRSAGDPRYDQLLADAQENGFDPNQLGNKVVVAVNHYGQAYILEGNTRIAVAQALGISSIKAEVRYWNGAEDVAGPMRPERVGALAQGGVSLEQAATALQRTPEFQRWFGNSAVVNPDGSPMMVYHASERSFDRFSFPEIGFHFAEDPELALNAAQKGGKIGATAKPFYISMQNPLVLEQGVPNSWRVFATLDLLLENGVITDEEYSGAMDLYDAAEDEFAASMSDQEFKAETAPIVVDLLKSKGYDGIKYWNTFDAGPSTQEGLQRLLMGEEVGPSAGWSYIAFEPNQIKDIRNEAPTSAAGVMEQDGLAFDQDPNAVAPARAVLPIVLTANEQKNVNPIYTGGIPAKRLAGNEAAAGWLESNFAGIGSSNSAAPITDFTAELDAATIASIGKVMAVEAELALQKTGNAYDWYSGAMTRMLDVAAIKWPALTDDAAADAAGFGTASNARFVFTFIMAITSQNLDVAANAVATNKAFDAMLLRVKAGNFTMDPAWGTGDKQKAMGENFKKFGPLIAAMEGATFSEKLIQLDALFREKMTVAQWVSSMKAAGIPYSPPSSTNKDVEVYGSSLLGPKIGNGFWQNLNGNFSPLTIDLWMRRTWGRLTGKSIGNPSALPAQRARLKASIVRSINSPERDTDALLPVLLERKQVTSDLRALEARTDLTTKEKNKQTKALKAQIEDLTEVAADLRGLPPPEGWQPIYDTDDVALAAYAKRLLTVWNKEYKRLAAKYPNAVPPKAQPTWARAAKRLKADLTTPLDQVANGAQRKQIEAAVRYAQELLTQRGLNITTADLQAILWYPEKELWGALTTKLAVDDNGDPVVLPSPLNESYDTAFTRILKGEGYDTGKQGAAGDPTAGGGAGTIAGGDAATAGFIGQQGQGVAEPDGEAGTGQADRLTFNQDRVEPTRDGRGRPAGGSLAPLEGAPTVSGATGPDPRLVAVAESYASANGIDLRRQAEFVEVDPERGERIAEAYEAMLDDPQNPEVKEAYQNMIAQTLAQYQALVEAGYKIWFIDTDNDPDGYSDSPFNAMRDLRANQSMGVFPTTSGYGSGDAVLDVEANPLLEDTGIQWPFGGPDGPMKPVLANDLFRAVHDAFGHGLEGAGFRARGEENAWQAHIRLFTGSAAAAMTSETRGQNSWLNFNPVSGETNQTAKVDDTTFAAQKIGLMPSWTWEEGKAGDMPAPAALEQSSPTGPQTNDKGAVGAPRGSYVPPTSMDPRNLINLTTTADVTTFVHESGHMFLFQMMQDLADPRLTPEGRATLTKQIDSMRGWFGRNADQGLADLKRMSESATKRAASMPMGAERDQATLRAMRLTGAYNRAAQNGGPAYMQGVAAAFMNPSAAGHDEAAEVVFHELWARGFEQYMGTGTAPTSELAKLFAQFSKFITTIYQSLRRLNVEITPEIADVFDRLLAGEEALQAERSGSIYQVPDAVFEGATPAEAKRLRELAAEAEAEASIMMQSRIASSLRAEEVNKRNARREQLMVEVTEQVQNEPVYAALTIARTGITPNGDKKIGNDPLVYAEVAAFVGEDFIPRLPKGVVSGKKAKPANPISLAMLRDLSGYDDTIDMLLAMGDPELEGQQVRIKRLVEERMTAEFGDEKDMSRFKDRAIEIAQNDKFQQLQVLLVRVLRRMAASDMATVADRQTERRGAPSAGADVAAGAAADTALAAATKPQDVVQAGLQKIRAEVQKKANVKGRRAQRAASLTTATIRRGIDPEAIKLAALRFVGKAKVGDMTPLRYRQAAQRLTIKIEQAIATRNYTEAAALMEQRAMNFAVAEQAAIVQGKVDTKRTYWSTRLNRTDKRLAASYDMDHVNTIRALMQPFGFAREASRNYNARAALSALSTTEPALYKEMMAALTQYAQISQRAQQTNPKDPIKGLTVLEFEELLDLADRLLAGARDSKGILINGERIAFEQIGAEVAANVQQRRKVQQAARSRRAGRGGKTMRMVSRSLNGFKAMLRRIELWAKDIDNGNPMGPVTQYLVRPVMEAVDTYMAKRQEPQKQLLSLLKGRSDLQARRPIAAPELGGYTFQTKGELLMAILHTGNDSNKRKLLLGGAVDVATGETYVWGSENKDGTLDTSRWDAFFQRMVNEGQITQADMDLAQGIWDLFETTKSAAQEAHKRMYGYYFAEIEATPLNTPFGVYKGGYAPAITDKMMSPDGDRHEAEEVMSQQANAAMFPAAEKGFTISRVAGGIGPLDLDMSRIPSHLDRVMKFAHLGPAVRNAARLVKNRAFSDAIRVASPDVIDVAVIPWLQRTVQQRVTTPPTNRGWNGVDKIAQAINNRVGLHLMAGNILNAAQQITGFPVAAAVVPARHLAAALTTFRVNGQGARAHILSRSTFMVDRMTDGANEVATTLENYLSEPSMLSAPRKAAERLGYFAQQLAQNLVDPTVWLAAERHGMTTVYPDVYAAELEKTGDEAAADAAATKAVVFYADSVVRQTQAPIRASDISGIEGSSALARLFLKFYSYFNAMGNLMVTEWSIAQNTQLGWTSRQGRAFYAYLMIIAVPSIVAESMSQLAQGNLEELEEDEIDQMMIEILVGSQIKTTLATIPYVGQVGGLVYGVAATEALYDDKLSMPAGLSVLSGTVSNLTKLVMVAADPDTDVDTKKAIKATLDAFALASGIPTNWLSKPLQYAADVHEGKSTPQGLTDLLQGALTGKDGTAD